ncbi:hypothetical protein BZB76_0718 [Actinomadura pelletieri DSM 43383]|uniref:Uncharacterized protein n=1 Tax=Actinomadura pelletieri DSM 43383 TaxID=1120940 RepID=A0A495QZI4_9ACTN|nr:hypothetical protein [Actinomadura pelletieri]RKS79266.1 hypothetical protein BZB76_0718 [Actinomadura pelletieri DSM 43383]
MTRDCGYEVDGEDGAYLITDRRGGRIVGVFYAEENAPGWWRGRAHGKVRRLFVPVRWPGGF